jgi:hypothetical protein
VWELTAGTVHLSLGTGETMGIGEGDITCRDLPKNSEETNCEGAKPGKGMKSKN